jgi:hypothetical protein
MSGCDKSSGRARLLKDQKMLTTPRANPIINCTVPKHRRAVVPGAPPAPQAYLPRTSHLEGKANRFDRTALTLGSFALPK